MKSVINRFESPKEDEIIQKTCSKFNKFYKETINPRKAITYLKLRDDGCIKKKALLFCSKPTCRVDCTKIIDGPSNCRSLKDMKKPLLTIHVNLIIFKFIFFFFDFFENYLRDGGLLILFIIWEKNLEVLLKIF